MFETTSSSRTTSNIIIRKLAAWAAIIAVPTAVTGFHGQDVPYPGFSQPAGLLNSIVLIVIGATGLYALLRHRSWLWPVGSRSVLAPAPTAADRSAGPPARLRSKFGANQLRARVTPRHHEDKPAAQSASDSTGVSRELLRNSGRSAQTATTSYSVSCVSWSTSMSVFCRRRASAARPSRRPPIDPGSSPVSSQQRMNRSCEIRHPSCRSAIRRTAAKSRPSVRAEGSSARWAASRVASMAAIEAARNYVPLSAQRVDRPGHVRLPPRSPDRAPGRTCKRDEPLLLVNDQDTAAHQRIVSSHSSMTASLRRPGRPTQPGSAQRKRDCRASPSTSGARKRREFWNPQSPRTIRFGENASVTGRAGVPGRVRSDVEVATIGGQGAASRRPPGGRTSITSLAAPVRSSQVVRRRPQSLGRGVTAEG